MPRLRRDRGVAHRARAVDVRGLWTSGVGDRGHHFPGDPYSVVRLVPGDLVGGQPKKWRQRAGPTARARLGQLPHGVDVAAQAATRDGAAWPGPGVGGGRGGRDPRGRARGGRRPPTPGEEGAGGHCGRGAGPGHRPHPDAAGGRCLSRQPADVRAARGAAWLGGDHRRAPELPPPAQARLSPRPEGAPWSWRVGRGGLASRPPGRVAPQALAPAVRIRAASVASISTITATSSPFGSIDEPHAIAGSSSIGSWNRPWRWIPFPTRRWSRVSV